MKTLMLSMRNGKRCVAFWWYARKKIVMWSLSETNNRMYSFVKWEDIGIASFVRSAQNNTKWRNFACINGEVRVSNIRDQVSFNSICLGVSSLPYKYALFRLTQIYYFLNATYFEPNKSRSDVLYKTSKNKTKSGRNMCKYEVCCVCKTIQDTLKCKIKTN